MDTERINSVKLTDNSTGVTYELDFNRESVVFAEGRGFDVTQVPTYPVTGLADLFYYSFRMHHRSVARDKTDKLLKRMGGMAESLATRLMSLYVQAQTSNSILTGEEAAKNSEVTVEL